MVPLCRQNNLIIKPIHSKGKSGSIKKELKRATKLSMKKNVIIIVVGGLSAGFRFAENIKKNIRFVFETYKILAIIHILIFTHFICNFS